MKKVVFFVPLFIGAFTALSGCATTVAKRAASDTAAQGNHVKNIETVYSAERRKGAMWFNVKTTGCTSEKSFRLAVTEQVQAGNAEDKNKVLAVTLVREKPDYCKAMPGYTAVVLSHPLLQTNASVIVMNPFAQKAKPAHKRQVRTPENTKP